MAYNRDNNNKPRANIGSVMRKLEEIISRKGHAVLAVQGNSPLESYSYSVGLTQHGWPELVVMSIMPTAATMIINEIVSKLKADGVSPDVGMTVSQALPVPIKIGAIPKQWTEKNLNAAFVWVPNTENVTALQLIWPDNAGRLPSDDGYDFENYPQKILSTH